MIKSVIIEDNKVGIPILESSDFCWLKWEEEETAEQFLRNAALDPWAIKWCTCCVWSKNDKSDDGTFDIDIYDVIDMKTGYEFHLICYGSLNDFSDIKNCVCIPFNRLNLLAFYRDFLLPFSDKKFFHG